MKSHSTPYERSTSTSAKGLLVSAKLFQHRKIIEIFVGLGKNEGLQKIHQQRATAGEALPASLGNVIELRLKANLEDVLKAVVSKGGVDSLIGSSPLELLLSRGVVAAFW